MPSPVQTETTRNQYLSQERRVNIQENLQRQEAVQSSGLEGIEIRSAPKSLGKDDFLKLLVTQLSHQDPTQPVQDQQFIAQMAQFSSLEQMQNISQGIGRLSDTQSYDSVGKFAMGVSAENGEQVSGIVQAVFYQDDKLYLKVGPHAVLAKDVQLIGDPAFFRREYGGLGGEAAPASRNGQVQPANMEGQNASGKEAPVGNSAGRTVPAAAGNPASGSGSDANSAAPAASGPAVSSPPAQPEAPAKTEEEKHSFYQNHFERNMITGSRDGRVFLG